jgi:hypothetical protein
MERARQICEDTERCRDSETKIRSVNLQRKADGKSRDRGVQRQNTGREVIRQTGSDTEECA